MSPLLEHDVPQWRPVEPPPEGPMSDDTARASASLGPPIHRLVALLALAANGWRRLWVREPETLGSPEETAEKVRSWGTDFAAIVDRAVAAIRAIPAASLSSEAALERREAITNGLAKELAAYLDSWQAMAHKWASGYAKGLKISAEMAFGFQTFLLVKANTHVQRTLEVAHRLLLARDPCSPLVWMALEKELFFPHQLFKPYGDQVRALLLSHPQPDYVMEEAEARDIVESQRRMLVMRINSGVSELRVDAVIPGER